MQKIIYSQCLRNYTSENPIWGRGNKVCMYVTRVIPVPVRILSRKQYYFSENNFVPVRGENELKPRSQYEILVPYRGSFQN